MNGVLFEIGQQVGEAGVVGVLHVEFRDHAGRQTAVGVVETVQCQADLMEVVAAGDAGRGGADLLDGRQQQADQDADDADHHQ